MSSSLPEAGSSAPDKNKSPLIGVLAMQGAFAEHMVALKRSGASTRLVRTREDLDGLDGIVLPGGESTTMTMLLERTGVARTAEGGNLGRTGDAGRPAPGMIVLARDVVDGMSDQHGLGLLDIGVRRKRLRPSGRQL